MRYTAPDSLRQVSHLSDAYYNIYRTLRAAAIIFGYPHSVASQPEHPVS